MALVRLLYRSDSELSGSDRAVREAAFAIADAACVRNNVEGVCGALMFVGGVFVQVLEGDSAAVEAIFERVCGDFRHRRIVLLDYSEVRERAFEEFGMVAFEGDDRARALFPTNSDAPTFQRSNRLSANTAVALMRSLLVKRTSRVKDRQVDRLIATNVIATNVMD